MAAKIRSSDGCWTCRLRRKKCDEMKPACDACLALEIDCLYSEAKPEWMDGGELQKEKAEWLKVEVKRLASSRREKKYLHGPEAGDEQMDITDTDDLQDSMMLDEPGNTDPTRNSSQPAGTSGTFDTPSTSAASSTNTPSTNQDQLSDHQWQPNTAATTAGSSSNAATPNSSTSIANASFEEHELTMAMMYLDYVFPFLFPFYRPALMDAGRGWLLVLLSRNKALFHAALSISSYFFSVSLDQETPMSTCQLHSVDLLEKQQDLALKELQHDMCQLNRRGFKDSLVETARVMASIVQLMTSEVAVPIHSNNHWQIHLNAASELFLEIMGNDGIAAHHTPCWTTVLNLLDPHGYLRVEGNQKSHGRPWNSDQASLRFFTATLFFSDVIASTALGQAPRLQAWHRHLLAVNKDHGPAPQLHLEQFVGIENWVIIAIGEIAELAAWKKEMKKAGSLSMTQLVARAAVIEKTLRANTFRMESSNPHQRRPLATEPVEALVRYRPQLAEDEPWAGPAPVLLMTLPWATAAITYLNVVVSGWQPASPEIRESVSRAIHLFSLLESPSCIRVHVWPFCLTGCLAGPDQEQMFRDIVEKMGKLQIFGSIREALAIMENVWSNRANIEQNPDAWDLSVCLQSLGHPSLLI